MYLETCEQQVHGETTTNMFGVLEQKWNIEVKYYFEIFYTYLHFSNITDTLLINVEKMVFLAQILQLII